MSYGHAYDLMLRCHACNRPAIVKSDDDGMLRCVPCQKEHEAERCPWCGLIAPPEVGTGPKVNPTQYDAWIEAHVPECEPWLAENGAIDG